MKRAKPEAHALYFKGGMIVDPAHGLCENGELIVEGSSILAIGKPKELAAKAKSLNASIIDCAGAVVAPGFIDLNARVGDLNTNPRETLVSFGNTAAAGGFSSVAVMPEFGQVNDNPQATDFLLRHAAEATLVRIFPIGAITRGFAGERLAEIGSMAEAGAVALADDGLAVMDAYLFRKALEYAKAFSLPVFSFPQDRNLVGRGVVDEGVQSCRLGLRGIPAAAEEIMVHRDLVLASAFEGRLHFSLISTKGAVRAINDARHENQMVTAETSPAYFSLTSADVTSYDPSFKFLPPLRSREHVEAIIEALANGTIDAISSGHTPLNNSLKDLVFEHAVAGMIALETVLPLSLELVRRGKLTLERMVALLTSGPARVLGLDAKGLGTLRAGGPADIVVFDPEKEYRYTEHVTYASVRNSPYFGRKLTGAVRATFVGGIEVSKGLKLGEQND